MSEGVYPLVVILVGVIGTIRGFRIGFARQISNVLGIAFGIVCARIFYADASNCLHNTFPFLSEGLAAPFLTGLLAAGGIYTIIYYLFSIFTGILRSALQILSTGMLNSLAGSVLCLLKYLIFVSLAYNLIADLRPDCRMVHYAGHNDGNVVDAVMCLAPALLDFPGITELRHAIQLEEASKIS